MAGKVAYVFPGQGAQAVGMGKDLYDAYPAAKAIFDEADAALDSSISKLCFEGPAEELTQTINAQPAILTTSLAALAAAQESGKLDPSAPVAFVAGHSLGEYTALVAADVLDVGDAVKLVRERGRLMQEAGERSTGTMAAIIGLNEAVIQQICDQAGAQMANLNSAAQTVISGTVDAVKRAMELAQEKEARRAVQLNVSGAFHSRLMEPAATGLRAAIERANFRDAKIPLVANGSAKPLTRAGEIKEELIFQLTNPVRWWQSVEHMINEGVDTFNEIGPGTVLSGLIGRINSEVKTVNINDAASLKE